MIGNEAQLTEFCHTRILMRCWWLFTNTSFSSTYDKLHDVLQITKQNGFTKVRKVVIYTYFNV